MKLPRIFPLLAALLLLTACSAPAARQPPEEPAPAPETLPVLDAESVPALLNGFTTLKTEMPPADYEILAGYFTVLGGAEPFRWVAGPYRNYPNGALEAPWESRDVTMTKFHDALWGENGPKTNALVLDSLAIQDVDGDGEAELVLLFQDMGYHYLILHQADGVFYGTDLSVRWFESLQQNGVYMGSGGADTSTYYRMTFQDGMFVPRELGSAIGDSYTIDSQSVTEQEFEFFLAETMPGDVAWYRPNP